MSTTTPAYCAYSFRMRLFARVQCDLMEPIKTFNIAMKSIGVMTRLRTDATYRRCPMLPFGDTSSRSVFAAIRIYLLCRAVARLQLPSEFQLKSCKRNRKLFNF